jgi:small subunit ribosomal protein S16
MLKIRLQRVGRKHEPTFRLVLTDHTNSSKTGRFKEILGSYDPRKSTDLLKTDRIKHWLSMGATPTDTVHNLFVNHKVIDAKKKNVLPKKTYTPPVKEEVVEAPVVEETLVTEAPVSEPVAEAVVETSVENSPEAEVPAENTEVETATSDEVSGEPQPQE